MDKSTQYSLANIYKKARELYAPVAPVVNSAVSTIGKKYQDFGSALGQAAYQPFAQQQFNQQNTQNLAMQNKLQAEYQRQMKLGNTAQAQRLASVSNANNNQTIGTQRDYAQGQVGVRGKAASAAVGIGLDVLGASKLAVMKPGALATSVALPAAFGGGMAAITGGNIRQGIGQGLGQTFQQAGINAITNPLLEGAKIGPVAFKGLNPGIAKLPLLQRAGLKGLTSGAISTLENEVQTRVNEGRSQKPGEIATSFGMGFATGAGGEIVPAAWKATTGAKAETEVNYKKQALTKSLNHEMELLQNDGVQGRQLNGNYDKKVTLGKAVGSGAVNDNRVGLWDVRMEVDGKPVNVRKTAQEILQQKIPLDRVVRPANDVSMRFLSQAKSGGFIDPSALIYGKDAIPKELQPLAEEARKYKTAEEFANAQKPLLHGTPNKFEKFDINRMEGGQAWFTDNPKDITSGSAGAVQGAGQKLNIMERYVKPGVKLATPEMADRLTTDQLISEGYRGVKHTGSTDYGNWTSLFFPNEDTLTRKDLSSFFNKAKQQNPQGGFVDLGASVGKDPSISQDIPSQVSPTPVTIGTNNSKLDTQLELQSQLGINSRQSSVNPGDISLGTQETIQNQPPLPAIKSVGLSQTEKPSSKYFNTDTYKITPEGKQVVEQAIGQAKPRLEKVLGKTLSNKEVLQTADQSSKTLNKAVGRDQTLEWESALLKARQKLSALSEKGVVDKEYIDTLMTIKSLGTDIGRKLQSFSIGADPKLLTSKQAILEAVLKQADDADAVLKAAQGVDFNNLDQATTFYRKFIKPTRAEKLDLLRYNSMLSSPNTHINNIASNFQGTGLIAPIEKTITGGLDALKSALTGSPREYAVGEGAAYAKGYYSNVSNAVKSFTDVMTGKTLMDNPDIRDIQMYPGNGRMSRVEGALRLPMKLLEASDKFFTALTEGGETAAQKYKQSKGISLKGLTPDEAAAKRLFRSKLGDNQGSAILNAIDSIANKVQSMKSDKSKIVSTMAKFTLPFLRTPTNILKQGVEYSPLGVSTIIGATNKTELLSKAILGSSVAVGVATLLGADRLTWAEPTSEKQKNAFRAAGMQPYSVKIGDKWVSYSKLHPAVSFNFALIAAVKDEQDKGKIDDSQATTVLNGLAKWMKFYADQSYLKNIGDIIASNQGDIEGLTRIAGNYVQQAIPFRALMGWVTRLTDPYQRQVDKNGSILDKQLQNIASQIPLVSQSVPARKDMFDNPIPNQNPILNAFSPAKITTEQPKAKEEYNFLKEKARLQSESTQMKNKLKSEAQNNVSVQKVGAAEDTFVPGTNKTPLPTFGGQSIKDGQVNAPTPLSSQEKDKIGTYIQYGKSVSEKDLSNYFYGDMKTQASTSKYQNALHSNEVMSKLSKIENNEYLSDSQKQYLVKQGLSDIGLTPQDYEYYKVSKQSSDLKSLYANEQLSKLLSTPGTTPNTVNNWLINGRKTVNGEQLLNDSVISSLVNSGVIGKADGDYLKKVTVENGQVKVKASASKKPKKLKLAKLKKIKVKKQKQIKLKPISLKLKVKKLKIGK